MAFFDDMTTALQDYPASNVVIEIIDVVLSSGNVLNTLEQASFKVKVRNNGPLNLTGVTLRIKGVNGAKLKSNGIAVPPVVVLPIGARTPAASLGARTPAPPLGQFVDEIVSKVLPTIGGHVGFQTTETFTMKAPADATVGPAENLVKASLEAWDAELAHILVGHSDPQGAVNGFYSAVVVPA